MFHRRHGGIIQRADHLGGDIDADPRRGLLREFRVDVLIIRDAVQAVGDGEHHRGGQEIHPGAPEVGMTEIQFNRLTLFVQLPSRLGRGHRALNGEIDFIAITQPSVRKDRDAGEGDDNIAQPPALVAGPDGNPGDDIGVGHGVDEW